jgi:hypothetical protein
MKVYNSNYYGKIVLVGNEQSGWDFCFETRQAARAFKKNYIEVSWKYGANVSSPNTKNWILFTTNKYFVDMFSKDFTYAVNKKITTDIDYSKTKYTITKDQVLICLSDGRQHVVPNNKEEFSKVADLAIKGDFEEMMKWVEVSNAVKSLTFGTDITIANGILYYNGEEIRSSLTERIIEESQKKGGKVIKFINFFRKLHQNPSKDAIEMTYDFLTHNDLEITEDGDIEAWKYFSYKDGVPVDSYTENIPQYNNWTIAMPRELVTEDPTQTCSDGLHVASYGYVKGEQNIMKVVLNPKDLVSIPKDHDDMKCRCCEYKIKSGSIDAPKEIYGQLNIKVTVGKMGKILSKEIIEN